MKKLLLLLSLISLNAFATDRGVPCNSNSCKVKIVTKDSGGTDITSMNIGATAVRSNTKIEIQETSSANYVTTFRSKNEADVAPAGTFNITMPTGTFFGVLNIQCNANNNGDFSSFKTIRVARLGASFRAAQELGTTINGSGGACAFTVGDGGSGVLTVTHNSSCNGASMSCRWHLSSQHSD